MVSDIYFEKICKKNFDKLALYWSPISFQFLDLDNDYKIKRDLLCQVNFPSRYKDPDDLAKNVSWSTILARKRLEAADFKDLIPSVYYSVAITKTHYLLLFSFYHADDENHPNDLEGCLVIIEKNNSPTLYGMITIAHHDFVPYVVKGEKKPKKKPIWQTDFELKFEKEEYGCNVLVKQTKGKHPLYSIGRNVGWLEFIRRRIREVLGKLDDVIVYFADELHSTYSKERLVQGKETIYNPTISYRLINMLDNNIGLYEKFLDAKTNNGNDTFTKEGKFHITVGSTGQANGPWIWKPEPIWYGKNLEGQIWYDPAKVVMEMFDLQGKDFSTIYEKMMWEQNFREIREF